MGFFGKIKQFFGAGTVKVELSVPGQVEKSARQMAGKVTLTAVSDQTIVSVTATLKEKWTTGRGDDKQTKEFELGKMKIHDGFEMKAGESKAIDFVLPFAILKSDADQLKEKGGAIGALGKMAAFAGGEKSEYWAEAVVGVKGTAFSPSSKKAVKLL